MHSHPLLWMCGCVHGCITEKSAGTEDIIMGNQEPSVRGLLTRHCIVNQGKMRCTGKMHTGSAANAQGMPSLSGTPER
jgi:hypothetical protein